MIGSAASCLPQMNRLDRSHGTMTGFARKLVTIWAWSLLRSAGDDEAIVQQAQTLFQRLMDLRSMSSQPTS